MLERAFDVTLEARDGYEHRGLDGAVVIGTGDSFRELAGAGVPCLVASSQGTVTDGGWDEKVMFTSSCEVDVRLWGAASLKSRGYRRHRSRHVIPPVVDGPPHRTGKRTI